MTTWSGATDPERVLGYLVRQRLGDPAQRIDQQGAVRLERPAAEAVPVESDGRQLRGTLPPQHLGSAALHDREDPRAIGVAPLRHLTVELLAAAPRPAHRPFHGSLLLRLRRVRIGAVVEADDDVAAELELKADHPLGRQVPLLPGLRLAEDDLVVPDDATPRILADEAPDLEPAGVAQDRSLPVHEPMDPARRLDDARAGTAEEVKGVDHHPLDPDPAQVVAAGAAHAGTRRIGQEGRHGQRATPGDAADQPSSASTKTSSVGTDASATSLTRPASATSRSSRLR